MLQPNKIFIFLAVVITLLLYHFYFTSILFAYAGGHANFDFNQCSIGIYLQNVVFSFEKGLSGQNHSLLDFHHPIDKVNCDLKLP